MRIEVRLFATLTEHREGTSSGAPFEVELEEGASLTDLIAELAVPKSRVHLVMVDGRIVRDHTTPLADGSRIGLFPPVGGG